MEKLSPQVYLLQLLICFYTSPVSQSTGVKVIGFAGLWMLVFTRAESRRRTGKCCEPWNGGKPFLTGRNAYPFDKWIEEEFSTGSQKTLGRSA